MHPRSDGALGRAAAWLLGRASWSMGLSALVTVVALACLAPVVRQPFEYDFRNLRNQRSEHHGVGELFSRVGKIFPSDNISPIAVALVPTAAEAPAYRRALLERDCAEGERLHGTPLGRDPVRLALACAARVAAGQPTGGILDDVKIADAVLPSDQRDKLRLIERLERKLDDPGLSLLPGEDRRQLESLRPRAVRALTLADLPEPLARPFRERDGTVGRVALIFPVQSFQGWDGRNLIRLAQLTDQVALPDGATVEAAGLASVFAAMLHAIVPDGTRAALVALAGVLLLVLLFVGRSAGGLVVLGSLLVGVAWMAGAGAALGLKLNFLNFVALPVTLGIGVDYGVNVYARLRGESATGRARALAETGSAVALCSMTTIIGYGSLLVADNGALRSFGKLAGLGEAACLSAALLLLPALMSPRSHSEAVAPVAE
jgi:hypothetical protein